MRDTYVRMLDGVMSRSSDRSMYREAISYLQRVRQFPNGVETAKRLVNSWRVQFGGRKAMLDELGKAGYCRIARSPKAFSLFYSFCSCLFGGYIWTCLAGAPPMCPIKWIQKFDT